MVQKFFRRGRIISLAIIAGGSAFVYSQRSNGLYDPTRPPHKDQDKPHIVILGSGWGAASLLRQLDHNANVTICSARNFFLFTPLLTSTTVGSIESRSIMEPIRYLMRPGMRFVEADAVHIDPKTKQVTVRDESHIQGQSHESKIKYDKLVVAVGAQSTTFGIPGVEEHGCFLKEIEDGKKIRARLMDCIESAGFPNQPPEEVKRLLHAVVVGGGPTGIEYAGQLHDFLQNDLMKWYPESISGNLKITLIEALPSVLPMFKRSLIDYTESRFKDMNIEVLTDTRVQEVKDQSIKIQNKDGTHQWLPYGLLVWATGTTMRPLTRSLISQIPEQATSRRGLKTDGHLRVIGTKDIYALGDCADSGYVATAQVASQQGAYLADALKVSEEEAKPFQYRHLGALAYIGDSKAIAQFNGDSDVSGMTASFLWNAAYWTKQFSWRNRVLVGFDLLKYRIFGRDISRE